MRRREFIRLLGGAAATWPLTARTQGVNHPRVGYLFTSEKAEGQGLWEACRQGLRELGYREGENIILEPRWTEGHQEQLPGLVKELLGLNAAVLVTAPHLQVLPRRSPQTQHQLFL
jgi:putative ABC transport system substrate-binding protein